jgi:hypothetical protein
MMISKWNACHDEMMTDMSFAGQLLAAVHTLPDTASSNSGLCCG